MTDQSESKPENGRGTDAATDREQPTREDATQQAKDSPAAVEQTLREAVDTVDSQREADAVIEQVVEQTAGQSVEEAAQDESSPSLPPAATVSDEEAVATALTESARKLAATAVTDEEAQRESISDAVEPLFEPSESMAETEEVEAGRTYLHRALISRLGVLDTIDAQLFLWVNELPHPSGLNRLFYFLTVIYRAGMAWYALMLALLLWQPARGWRLIRGAALPLGLAIWLVEYPIKTYFRRKRPFITIVQAMVIGRKPGSWSFPSGHAATASAGAWLLGRYLPRWRTPLNLIAALTAFSRIYLGVHYPGDVVAGSTLGVIFARLLHWLFRRFLGVRDEQQ